MTISRPIPTQSSGHHVSGADTYPRSHGWQFVPYSSIWIDKEAVQGFDMSSTTSSVAQLQHPLSNLKHQPYKIHQEELCLKNDPSLTASLQDHVDFSIELEENLKSRVAEFHTMCLPPLRHQRESNLSPYNIYPKLHLLVKSRQFPICFLRCPILVQSLSAL